MNDRISIETARAGAAYLTIYPAPYTSRAAGFSRIVAASWRRGGYEDCSRPRGGLNDGGAWFAAVAAAVIINGAFVAAFAAKIATFVEAVR